MPRPIATGALRECADCGLQFDRLAELRRHAREEHAARLPPAE